MHLEIDKSVPIAGGMGGGSADAAATLVACDALWGTALAKEELHALAAKLGADVPFALSGGTAIGTGRGDRLSPALATGSFHWVLAVAEFGLSTPGVYRELDRSASERLASRARRAVTGRRHDGAAGPSRRRRAGSSPERCTTTCRRRRSASHRVSAASSSSARRTARSRASSPGRVPTVAFLVDDADSALELQVALSRRTAERRARARARCTARASSTARASRRRADSQAPAARLVRTWHISSAPSACTSNSRRAVVFDDVTLGIDEGDRIGIVGRNGDGKSTLLKLLAGRIEPDGGRVTLRGGVRVGMLDQADVLDPGKTVRRAVVGDIDGARVGGRRRGCATSSPGLLARHPVDTRRSRASRAASAAASGLAALLVGDWDVVFLDEPTNHLDVEGIAWLAEHLKARWPRRTRAALAGRDPRPVVPRRGLHATRGRCTTASSSPSRAATRRTCCSASSATAWPRHPSRSAQNLLRKELAWLRRGAPARTSKPKFRIEAANQLIADEPPLRDHVELNRLAVSRLGKDVVDLLDVSVVYPVADARPTPRDPHRAARRRVAHRARRAHRHPRRERRGQVDAARPRHGRRRADHRPGQARQDRAGRDPQPAARRARRVLRAPGARRRRRAADLVRRSAARS